MDYINQSYDSVTKMILVCPSCDTRYFTDGAALGSDGRRVRCTSCGHSWFAKPDADSGVATGGEAGLTREQVERLRQTAAANAAGKAGPHAEFRAREMERKRRNRMIAAGAAWAMGFLLFATVATSAVVFRNQVVNAWPKTASVYEMVGLEVNRFGLDFEGVSAKRSFDGTTPVLTVTGSAVNKGAAPRPAPQIRVSLRDETGEEVGAWTDTLPVKAIAPGEKATFVTRIVAPPVETYRLAVTFAPGAPGHQPHEKGEAQVGADSIAPAEPTGASGSAGIEHGEAAPADPHSSEAAEAGHH